VIEQANALTSVEELQAELEAIKAQLAGMPGNKRKAFT
jgi:hypothetical protein